jgi:chromosome segregation ATPase
LWARPWCGGVSPGCWLDSSWLGRPRYRGFAARLVTLDIRIKRDEIERLRRKCRKLEEADQAAKLRLQVLVDEMEAAQRNRTDVKLKATTANNASLEAQRTAAAVSLKLAWAESDCQVKREAVCRKSGEREAMVTQMAQIRADIADKTQETGWL